MKKIFACYLKDEKDLLNSSSGGAFTALTNAVFELKGSVIACKYDYKQHELFFALATNIYERNKMRGSKYIQADTKNLYSLFDSEIRKNIYTPLLVVGTPCQIGGIKSWMSMKKITTRRKIIFCDLICHGVSSSEMWKNYIKSIEIQNKKRIIYVTFKDKTVYGWIRPQSKVIFENGTQFSIDDFSFLYKTNNFMRESCYRCKYSNIDRISDITIGDFWNIDNLDLNFANKMGNSCVLINTDTGEWLFEFAQKWLDSIICNNDSYLQHNLSQPTQKAKSYKLMQYFYKKKGIKFVIDEFYYFQSRFSKLSKVKKKFFRLLHGA